VKARAGGRIGFSLDVFLRSMRPVSPNEAVASRERKQKFRERTSHARHAETSDRHHASATAMFGATCSNATAGARDQNSTRVIRSDRDREADVIWQVSAFAAVPPHAPSHASRSLAAVQGRENVPDDCDLMGLTCRKYGLQLEDDELKAVSQTVNASRYRSNITCRVLLGFFIRPHFLAMDRPRFSGDAMRVEKQKPKNRRRVPAFSA